MAKTKKKKKSNYYFTQEHEDAIIKYVKTRDRYTKGKLYEMWIQPAFSEMVDKICFTSVALIVIFAFQFINQI